MFKRSIRDEVVYIANGKLEAESVKILLESFDIPAFINQESAGSTFGLTVGILGEVEVIVPLSYVTEAKKIIEEMINGKLELHDSQDDLFEDSNEENN
ncbi:MAG: hypothetical protein C0417_00050 [Chlorobiaceae bacterium]|nr:MAG: hypothetical protein FD147_140 [Chloroflexota bacterium]MBA4311006.1 hypothetical protein [Chlorobiaceae bacterium]